MSVQWFSSRYFLLGFFTLVSAGSLSAWFVLSGSCGLLSGCGDYFSFDYVSFVFSLLSVFLGVSLVFTERLSGGISNLLIFLSVVFSILCYGCSHSLLFWGFYELSILFLLFLLVGVSPYSERFVASWYLLGYVVFTSLPMFLCILYLSLEVGSYNLLSWGGSCLSAGGVVSLVILGYLFITKIPLFPFHVWLPIVHAEAPSGVSVCLSGYVMKLGVLGLYRFCSQLLSDFIFVEAYVLLVLSAGIIYFLSSVLELDGKRWLAFLSLSHISVSCVGMSVLQPHFSSIPYYFCLGHGMSAGATFVLLWLVYELSGSRNWGVLKQSVVHSSVLRVVGIVCVFTVASVPPTLTFFSEVFILGDSLLINSVLGLVFCVYLFLSGLVPLFLLGFLLGRSVCYSFSSCSVWPVQGSLVFMLLWCYSLFLVL